MSVPFGQDPADYWQFTSAELLDQWVEKVGQTRDPDIRHEVSPIVRELELRGDIDAIRQYLLQR
ncbi:MAG: hypothetical protein ACU0CO_18470 [Shimia sp.]